MKNSEIRVGELYLYENTVVRVTARHGDYSDRDIDENADVCFTARTVWPPLSPYQSLTWTLVDEELRVLDVAWLGRSYQELLSIIREVSAPAEDTP